MNATLHLMLSVIDYITGKVGVGDGARRGFGGGGGRVGGGRGDSIITRNASEKETPIIPPLIGGVKLKDGSYG